MNGYNRVASLMAAHDELAIVRGYRSAYALDLLYNQAELHHLLQEWAELVHRDQSAHDEKRRSYDTFFFNLRFPEVGQKHNPQWIKWWEIRQKLKDYRQAINTFREVAREPCPIQADLGALRGWLSAEGGEYGFLRGSEDDIWNPNNEHDLISLTQMRPHDKAINKLAGCVANVSPESITNRFMKEVELKDSFLIDKPVVIPLKEFSNHSLHRFASVLSFILASMLPAASIFALIYIPSQSLRLGMIVVLCLLFSAVLMLVAGSTRIECFVATATFAAVQVVFVGQQNQTCSN